MIEIKDLSFSYISENKILSNINLNIKKGEVIALIGRSGCGKTTLTRVINGLADKYYDGKVTGDVMIDFQNIKDLELYEIGKVVGSIFQNPKSQFFAEIVEDEVAFGAENYGVDGNKIDKIVENSINRINGKNLCGSKLFNLSSGEKQKVAIASINAINPCVYVFDEPSANLDMESVRYLKELIADLKSEGKTVVISEHRLYYLMDIVDKFYQVQKGEIIAEYTKDELTCMSIDILTEKGFRMTDIDKLKAEGIKLEGSKKLKVENLTFAYKDKKIFDNINYEFKSKNIYGLIGKNGIGKTTFGKLISGLLKEQEGSIYIDGEKQNRKNRIKNIYYLTNNSSSNLFEVSVEDEIKLSNKKIDINKLLEEYNLLSKIDDHPQNLSGGQKQRLTLAVSESLDKDIYILDEPTSGLDGNNMQMISKRLKELQKKDKIIIVITHDYEFIMKTCSKVINLDSEGIEELDPYKNNGRILKILEGI